MGYTMEYIDKKRFPCGIITAVITPFSNGEIDYSSYKGILLQQLKCGIDGIVVLGTTGEAPTITSTERSRLIDFTLNVVNGKTFVIAGCGGADTKSAAKSANEACKLGVDGILTVTPYYNKPSQRGIIYHYLTVAESSEAPIMMYNVPSRTGVSIQTETARTLFAHENISALKEASCDIADVTDKLANLSGCDIFCGNDSMLLPFLSMGACGCISVVSNAVPEAFLKIYEQFRLGKTMGAEASFCRIYPLIKALGAESNPIPIKALMAQLGYCTNEMRLPLIGCDKSVSDAIMAAYEECDFT